MSQPRGLGIRAEASLQELGQGVAVARVDELDVGRDLPQPPRTGCDPALPGGDEIAQLGFVGQPRRDGALEPVPPERQRSIQRGAAEKEGARSADPVENRLGESEVAVEVVVEGDRDRNPPPSTPRSCCGQKLRRTDKLVVLLPGCRTC